MKSKPAVGTGVLLFGAALLLPKPARVAANATEGSGRHQIAARASNGSSHDQGKALPGPWQASCNYWGLPARNALQKQTNALKTHTPSGAGRSGHDALCGPDQWGLAPAPDTKPGDRPITALIATVPDPVHTSMAMEFDRMIDVITQAAADNGYATSYDWLPWQRVASNKGSAKTNGASAEESHDEEQEKQPGLLILKPAKPACDLAGELVPGKRSCATHTVYLFLVGQAPGFGTNRTQLRNALKYEQTLWSLGAANFSLRHPDTEADIIGPNSSGAASSLRAELDRTGFNASIQTVSIVGSTSTTVAAATLRRQATASLPALHFTSFSEDSAYEVSCLTALFDAPERGSRLAWLYESGTTFGSNTGSDLYAHTPLQADAAEAQTVQGPNCRGKMHAGADMASAGEVRIPFPREIAILRNAQKDEAVPTDAAAAAVADADPYLHLSLKNGDAEDTIPHFSREIFPYVEEAEWMATVRELGDRHTNTVAISASNVLDALFLAKSVYRDLPDVRPVFFASNDLLYVRAGDAEPYVGAIALTAYPLTGLTLETGAGHLNNFASFWTEAFYNAVSYTLWPAGELSPKLAGYSDAGNGVLRPPPLWITTIGRDGYYPLSIFTPCSSDNDQILPSIYTAAGQDAHVTCTSSEADAADAVLLAMRERHVYPAVSWFVVTSLMLLACVAHTITIRNADFWSPFTHDLDIAHGDEPRRRAVYLHIFTAMLFAMSAACSIPALCLARSVGGDRTSTALALLTLLSGVGAAAMTLVQTLPHLRRPSQADRTPRTRCGKGGAPTLFSKPLPVDEPWAQTNWVQSQWRVLRAMLSREQEKLSKMRFFFAETRLYPFFNVLAFVSSLVFALLWYLLCHEGLPFAGAHMLLGTFFCYRCLYPLSGVSPLLPVLLIALSWCLWAFLQTCRLRFSENSRPMLPGPLGAPDIYTSFYVHDAMLSDCSTKNSTCLYDNVTCLLITHRILWRASTGTLHFFNFLFVTGYVFCFALFVLYTPIYGLDHYLRAPLFRFHFLQAITPYELLIALLFYPLLMIALTGCLRMVMIWTSLRSGLLQRLERSPLRYAFSRLTNISWMTMLRQGGIVEYWRDMTRSNESMGQILHNRALLPFVKGGKPCLREALATRQQLEKHISDLHDLFRRDNNTFADTNETFLVGPDLPRKENRGYLNMMCAIECDYARFSELLLRCVLLPYWAKKRTELVDAEATGDKAQSPSALATPAPIQLAEEFLALRYLSLIRAVLINLRHLMTFISTSFVLALLAWNSYPFQPRRWIDWAFTALLLGLGAAIASVFAQMHRDPILSRVTGTKINELGLDFYMRLALFGAAPVLTWMASQFPAVGAMVSRVLQQGLAVAK